MEPLLNLLEETVTHFKEGARLVRAYTNDHTYVITKSNDGAHYWVTLEDSPFNKIEAIMLDDYFKDVFGIEAIY